MDSHLVPELLDDKDLQPKLATGLGDDLLVGRTPGVRPTPNSNPSAREREDEQGNGIEGSLKETPAASSELSTTVFGIIRRSTSKPMAVSQFRLR